MAGFLDFLAIRAAYDAGQTYHFEFLKDSAGAQANSTAGYWHSQWTVAGMPAAGANPASTPGVAYTNVAGSINFPDQGSSTKYLTWVSAITKLGILADSPMMVYDRLVGVGGMTLDSTGSKTVNSAALTRYTDGVGVIPCLEVTVAGTGAMTLSMDSYTDHLGNTGHAGPSVSTATATTAGQLIPLPVASGDLGVRAIATINISATTLTAGSAANLVLLKPVFCLAGARNKWNAASPVTDYAAFPRVYDGASLGIAFMGLASSDQIAARGDLVVIFD